jgi:hypothetical protein
MVLNCQGEIVLDCIGGMRPLDQDRTTALFVVENLKAVEEMRKMFPGLTATTANAIAYQIEQGDGARVKVTDVAIVSWLRHVAEKMERMEKILKELPR